MLNEVSIMRGNRTLSRVTSLSLIAFGVLDIAISAWFIIVTLMGKPNWMRIMFASKEISMIAMLALAALTLPKLLTGISGLKAYRLNKAPLFCKIGGFVSLLLELFYAIIVKRDLVWHVLIDLIAPSPHLRASLLPMLWGGVVIVALILFLIALPSKKDAAAKTQ